MVYCFPAFVALIYLWGEKERALAEAGHWTAELILFPCCWTRKRGGGAHIKDALGPHVTLFTVFPLRRSNSDAKCAKIRYDFVARNANELTVQKGEVLQVLDSEKQWWLLRNRSGQLGYVPCNVLEEVKAGEPQYNRAALFNSQAANPYKASSPPASVNHGESVEMNKSSWDKDSRTQQKEMNDELLKRITDSRAQPPARNFRVEHSVRTAPITYQSQPYEVHAWLNAKGFSRPVVDCLGILTGAQLFSLSKDELKAVCGDEGSRVFSQISVQKAQIESNSGDSELEEIMRRRQQEVDAFTWD
ncbi:hypothetical protein SRHO_G00086620 [Serrasalmus rhombeus]